MKEPQRNNELARLALSLWQEKINLENVQKIADISQELGFSATEKNLSIYPEVIGTKKLRKEWKDQSICEHRYSFFSGNSINNIPIWKCEKCNHLTASM